MMCGPLGRLWPLVALGLMGAAIRAEILTPPYFNLAQGRKIYASATCGEDIEGPEPELFCKLVGANADNDLNVNLIQGQLCDVCDPKNSMKRHPPEYAVDGNPTWWQSPPLSRGMKYNEVNLTIDLGQEFHVAYVFIRMGNSPRPGLWILEKSADYGVSWSPWQYFSDSKADCETYFGKESLQPITRDDSVVCTTEFSKILPLEEGEIAISTLMHRPSAHNYFNSSVLQEWTRATNIRFRLLRTKNLLGHLMSVQRQDPTVTRRYFYSISDISIGGRCMCNGHADSCDVTDPDDPGILLCRCRHHTCGAKCQLCCPGYEQKAWRISKASQPFLCEACNCFNHTDKCTYDADIDAQHLSLDIHGQFEGGGVCQSCQHNTEGINCNKCRATYYRPAHKHWNETDVCHRCNCDFYYSTGNCAEGSGRCECRPAFQPPDCDSCAFGYYAYPDCKPCECFQQGTLNQQCQDDESGTCQCKKNFGGNDCRQCADEYYNFPECEPCECNPLSSTSLSCNQNTGNCTCQINYAGKQCDSCANGYYNYPTCSYCDCDLQGALPSICDADAGRCLCRPGYGGARCDTCLPAFTGYPHCVPCNCSAVGSVSATCDAGATGKCQCLRSYAGRACAQCSAGNYKYPDCLPCNCDANGAEGTSCDTEGLCQCHHNFDGSRCNKCKDGFYNFPRCEDCNCHPAGVVPAFAGCGSVPEGELCECKVRVQGRICDRCRPLYWHLHAANPDGCDKCDCNEAGVLAGINVCDVESGQCTCKPTVVGRQCSDCADGTYQLEKDNLFGCTDCGCDVGGAVSPLCDKAFGQCACQPRVTGRTCTEPLQTHYFPTLYQYLYEVEDGRTPQNTAVRYGYDEKQFPNYSWRGYAVFSQLQTEIIQDIHLTKPSLYRMVLRYVNTHREPIVGYVRITPDNTNDAEQRHAILFKPTNSSGGEHVTVSGAAGNVPSALVMNPGRWSVGIQVERSMLLDYFVLLPEDFYLATILNEKVEAPCTVREPAPLCRTHSYPNVSSYDASWGTGGYVDLGEGRIGTLQDYMQDKQHLSTLSLRQRNSIPLLHPNQEVIDYNLTLSKPGDYVLLVNYLTPLDDLKTHTVAVKVIKGDTNGNGEESNNNENGTTGDKIVLYKCVYAMICRQAVVTSEGIVAVYNVGENSLHVQLKGNNSNVGIHSLTAIPISAWNLDYIQPRPVCVRKNGRCIPSKYPNPPETKKIQFEQESLDNVVKRPIKETDETSSEDNVGENEIAGSSAPSDKVKLYKTNTSTYVELEGGAEDGMFDLKAKVPSPGLYTVIVHYYQPDYPEFEAEILIQNGQMYEAKVPLSHCPSTSGCRAVVAQTNGDNKFQLIENFIAAFKIPRKKHVYLDYLLVVPYDLFNIRLLEEEDLDRTGEFISTCGHNHFHMDTNVTGFCRQSVFSISAGHNNGALYCQCDYDGSQSFECAAFGGQCPCRPNIVGRTCSACKTGYFGFPDCRPCHCPSTAICEPNTGQCICPKHVTGERCDQCTAYTYGFDPIIGCEECKCNALGVTSSLQCDLLTGNCDCKENIVGRQCSDCAAGHYYFPYCEQCECAAAGTIETICDPNTAECLCKKQVTGPNCFICKEGAYNLDETNPDGCTECFCFGKTTRCIDSNLVRTRLFEMIDWKLVTLEESEENGTLIVTPLNLTVHQGDDSTVGVDFTDTDFSDKIVYFAAPKDYLGKHLTSYGAVFEYHVFYTIGQSGKATMAADVVLHGPGLLHLNHMDESQPPAAQEYQGTVNLLERTFVLPNGAQAKREHIMAVLQNLRGVYIRATYWSDSVTSKISNVFLGTAAPLSDYRDPHGLPLAGSVEQCLCPPNYRGGSCEDCALGHYRTATVGPHGGFCVPCQCNGHAEECDVDTGVCANCQHNTWGDHCEKCSVGYHGNALQGTPNDCLICACPLPIGSNNFATACDVSADGNRIDCDCTEGYIGDRCQSCGAGYFGRPEQLDDYCKPCQCSGNIRANDPGSCDTVTGLCMNCLNNTYGEACALCAPSYYGDAVLRKDCQSCVCDDLGTARCDPHTGDCQCLPHVTGDKCDRCDREHYGFSSGRGCVPCDCADASLSGQCDDVTGQCRCAAGVTGRRCDRCLAGWWRYTSEGCVSCGCKSEYSLGVSCNPQTGRCECLRGVEGEKCDRCPHRWAFVAEYGCHDCDRCVHDLLDTTDELAMGIDGLLMEFDNVDSGFFTTRKLAHINDTIRILMPKINLLDPEGINLSPLIKVVDGLEQDVKNINRKVNYSVENSESLGIYANNIKNNASEATKNLIDVLNEIDDVIDNIELISSNIMSDNGPRLDMAVVEAQELLDSIKAHNITEHDINAREQLEKVNTLLDDLMDFKNPVDDVNKQIQAIRDKMEDFNLKLDDLYNHTRYSDVNSDEAERLHGTNGKDPVEKKLAIILNQTTESQQNLNKSHELLKNATDNYNKAKDAYEAIALKPGNLIDLQQELADKLHKSALPKTDSIEMELMPKVLEHASNLSRRAEELDNMLTETRNTSENAVRAATAYNEINKAIEDAESAAKSASDTVTEATEMLKDVEGTTMDAVAKSEEHLLDAHQAVQQVGDLKKLAENGMVDYGNSRGAHKKNEDKMKVIDNFLDNNNSPQIDEWLIQAKNQADAASVHNKKIGEKLTGPFKDVHEGIQEAKALPKKLDDANNNIEQVRKQLRNAFDRFPSVSNTVDELEPSLSDLTPLANDISERIKKLQQQIAVARDLADRIPVGIKLHSNTTLQLRNPPHLAEGSSTSTRMTGYFRTPRANGLVLYVGNGVGTKLRGTQTDDYMALQVEGGYPVLSLDLGNGPERIVNNKYVADNQWYQFIIERTGLNAQLSIRAQNPDKTEQVFTEHKQLEGPLSIFNLDQNRSRIIVGSYDSDFHMQDRITQQPFEGELEELTIGDRPVSLWNFVKGDNNNEGAFGRDKLINLMPSTGYRFNGAGYAILDARSYALKTRSDIQLSFKTYAPDGLLFLYGRGRTFIALEIRNGKVLYKYNLGSSTKVWYTPKTYNDGQWHTVQADRDGHKGKFVVDGADISDETPPVTGHAIELNDTLFVGGYPQRHPFRDVTNQDFDGCIDQVSIRGSPVDLSDNIKAYGVTPGCPDKFARLVSFSPHHQHGHLRLTRLTTHNDLAVNLKFKTKAPTGLIFYLTDAEQKNGVSLALLNGELHLISQGLELVSTNVTFNDNDWHVISVRHNKDMLRLDYDDYGYKAIADSEPPKLHIMYGDLYIGGVPDTFRPKRGSVATSATFSGCIGDATVQGDVLNFANSTDKASEFLGKCVLDKQIGSDTDVHQVPELPPLDELDHYTTLNPDLFTEEPFELGVPKRGDGGKDGIYNASEPPPPLVEIEPISETTTTTTIPTTPTITTTTTVTLPLAPEVQVPVIAKPPPRRLEAATTAQPPPPPDGACALPLIPKGDENAAGTFKFTQTKDKESRMEYMNGRGKYKKQFTFDVEIKTFNTSGIILYIADTNHSQYVTLYLEDGFLVYKFASGTTLTELRSPLPVNDGQWRSVHLAREQSLGQLTIDTQPVLNATATGSGLNKMDLYPPFYLGGVAGELHELIKDNVGNTEGFNGCIRSFNMNNRPMENPVKYNVLPCSENVEVGTFFGAAGGYVKLKERFKVGLEIDIKMDIKPRNTSGLLVAVHGKKDYLVLEMIHGVIKLSVDNGKGPITTSFEPPTPFYFCDGHWHNIQAVKSKSVVTLSVDRTFTQPGVGDHRHASTDTISAFFLGGHRQIARARGLAARRPYTGCVRRVQINGQKIEPKADMIEGAVTLGSCATN